jgi:predicted transposase YbfD/YdcC
MKKTQSKKQTYARTVNTLIDHFKSIAEPRKNLLNVRHRLIDIIVISVLGIIAGADGPTAIEKWAKLHKKDLKKYLKLTNGIPSHDIINTILQTINPKEFQDCFVTWTSSVIIDTKKGDIPEQIAIDGKQRRRSFDKKNNLGAMNIVSAWKTEQGIALGQVASEEKSNEITAIPKLLRTLSIEGTVISIDAAGTQKSIASLIVEKGADYVLALKGNQGKLHNAAIDFFETADLSSSLISYSVEEEKGHGREEKREYYQVTVPKEMREREKWKGLKTIGMVVRTYKKTGEEKIHCETRYFISSLRRNIKLFSKYVRGHWGIENGLHWVLDMAFREDESRARNRILAENLSWINRVALTLLKQHPAKDSLVGKRRACAWSFDFLMQVVTGQYN